MSNTVRQFGNISGSCNINSNYLDELNCLNEWI
jgi:hypothetical protein